jgi:ABC-2 type transport system ATP-binding protein
MDTACGVSLVGIRRSFPGFELGPLSLDLLPGHAYGLLGPNGAGKTTLLNILAQQLRPSFGDIRDHGKPVCWGDRRWKARIGYIKETPVFYDELTVRETIGFTRRLYNNWDAGFTVVLLRRFQLDPAQRVGTMSKGTKVKLGIVLALSHGAKLLILDEPTAGLDPTARADLHETLRDLMHERQGLCLLLSSHIFEDLERVTQEVLILRAGQLVFRASHDELRELVMYRLPEAVAIDSSPEIRLAWRRDGQQWVMVPKASAMAAHLRSLPGSVEERHENLLAAAYYGTQR